MQWREASRRHACNLVKVASWALVLVLALRSALALPSEAVRPSHGFIALYTSAQMLREGQDLRLSYNDDWFNAQIARFVSGVGDVNINPPTFALLGLPLTIFDYAHAHALWTLFSLLCLIGAVTWLLWKLRLHGLWTPLFVATVLLFQPVLANVHLGQVYLVMLALFTCAWDGYRERHDARLGIALGVLGIFKLAGLLLVPLLLVQGRWRALLWDVGTMLAIGVASLPLIGLATWQEYPEKLLRFSTSPSLAVSAYQTTTSIALHLFAADAQWNPAPLVEAPALATWLPRLAFALVLGVPLALAYRERANPQPSDLTFAVVVVASVVLSPLALDYHYPLLLLTVAVLVAWFRRQPSRWLWLVFALGVWLIGADLPYRSPRLASGAWALLAYPKLYGACLLWGLAVWGAYRVVKDQIAEGDKVGSRWEVHYTRKIR